MVFFVCLFVGFKIRVAALFTLWPRYKINTISLFPLSESPSSYHMNRILTTCISSSVSISHIRKEMWKMKYTQNRRQKKKHTHTPHRRQQKTYWASNGKIYTQSRNKKEKPVFINSISFRCIESMPYNLWLLSSVFRRGAHMLNIMFVYIWRYAVLAQS